MAEVEVEHMRVPSDDTADTLSDPENTADHSEALSESSVSLGNTLDGENDDTATETALANDEGKMAKLKPEAISVKPVTGKDKASPKTPLVKKIINSGTFGAGSIKTAAPPATTKVNGTTVKPTATAPVVKKSLSAPSSAPTKAPMATVKSAAPLSASVSAAAPTTASRRTSMAPPAKAPTPTTGARPTVSKPALSASTSAKPPLSSSTSAKPPAAATRTVISPAGSASNKPPTLAAVRPRASVSNEVKRAPAAPRPSSATTAKPTSTSASKPPATSAKPTRAGHASISSIKEVKEDNKALEALQVQLTEASEALAAKTEVVTELESKVAALQAEINATVTDMESHATKVVGLEGAKSAAETKLAQLEQDMESSRSEHAVSTTALLAVQKELDGTKASAAEQTRLVESLTAQIESMQAEIAAARANLITLQESHDATAVLSESAATDHAALLKAKEDLDAISKETELLKGAHLKALEEATHRVDELQAKLAQSETLQPELTELKKERTELASKLSEVEVEILELKEVHESAEDQRSQTEQRLKTLQGELNAALVAEKTAQELIEAKVTEHSKLSDDLKASHAAELKAAGDIHDKVVANLATIQEELSKAQNALAEAKAEATALAETHSQKLAELESNHATKHAELSEAMAKVKAELEGQEAQYNAKVDAVKAEHDHLLQEAFERAKLEAGSAHGDDLQALRAESQATIEQLRAAHQLTLENLKREHADLLEDQVQSLEKKIAAQSLELKATQDDLSKAKAALESSKAEVETLKAQLNEVRASAEQAAASDPKEAEEIKRLTQELGHKTDDLDALNEMLSLTKSSLTDMSNHHTIELEEAAKFRAAEVTKLRSAHDEEVTSLAKQKSDLLTQLSDLEGELATVKAAMTAERSASPKTNGNGTAHPSSPGVTKEDLQQMHEAHNLKIHDLKAEHDKALKALQEELEAERIKSEGYKTDVGRKAMEIQYLEQEQDENQDQITRMKEDIAQLMKQLKAKDEA